MISEFDEVKKILDQNDITDLDQIEYGSEAYEELFSYYADQGEIPYGVMKARDGMPDEWIMDRLIDLGFDKEFEQKQDLAKHYRWKGMI
tara:strand:+ start:353 stop:619 length:267 start_codon:yes stop_codon:yes gene_type:complete